MHAKGGISRLAPSPTGALHLGHACTFVANWLLARKSGWRLLLRLDDLDAPRVQSSGHIRTVASSLALRNVEAR